MAPADQPRHDGAARGALGGAANEAGAAHRTAVALHFVVASLAGQPVPEALPAGIRESAEGGTNDVPTVVRLETDEPTDDIEVLLSGGHRVLLQAKRKVGMSVLLEVTRDQWLPAVLDPAWHDGTALVLAAEQVTADVAHLGQAWARRQDVQSGNAGPAEGAVLRKWEAFLSRELAAVPPADASLARSRLAAAAVLLPLQGRLPGHAHRQVSIARLAGSVVAEADASAAADALRSALQIAAQRRTGGDVAYWTAVLAAAGIEPLTNPEGTPAAQLAAKTHALLAYRDRLSARLNRLPLHDLGIALPDVNVPGLAAGVSVADPAEPDRHLTRDLLSQLRCHRRILLLGQPGGGKSLALTQVAAFAADPSGARVADASLLDTWDDLGDWAPIPILVSLRSLLPRDRRDPVMITPELVASHAAEGLPLPQKALVTAELARRLRAGAALLLLDGLDECRGRRPDVVAAFPDFANTLHEDVTIVISARASARDDAAALGCRPILLAEPRRLTETVDVVLRTLLAASAHGGSLDDRREWLRRQESGHQDLFQIPLMAVLAATVAAQADALEFLPTGRATLVKSVLETQMRVWEARRREEEDLAIGTLDPGTAARAVMDTFAPLAHACSEAGVSARSDAAVVVQQVLMADYISSSGQAAEAAQQVLWTWGEASVFVVDDRTVRPRLRLFGETGEALHALGCPSELQAWVVARLNDADRHPELLLACELSEDAVDLVVSQAEQAAGSDRLLVADLASLAEDAIDASASAGAPTRQGFATQARRRLSAVVESALRVAASTPRPQSHPPLGRDAREDAWATWRLAEIALRVGDGETLRSVIAPLIHAVLREPLAVLWRAAMWTVLLPAGADGIPVRADHSGVSTPPDALAAWTALIETGLPAVPSDPRLMGLDFLLHGWNDRGGAVMVRAAAAVLPARPDLAPSLVEAIQYLGQPDAQALEATIQAAGHPALLEARSRERALETPTFTRWLERDNSHVRAWLQSLGDGPEGATLTDGQRWRLPELGALVALYDLGGLTVGEHSEVLAHAPDVHHTLDNVAVTLLGLDRLALAAEARQLAAAWPADRSSGSSSTLLHSRAPGDYDWRRSRDPDGDRGRLIEVAGSGWRMLVYAVCNLLEGHPDPAGTATLLCQVLPEIRAEAQYIAAITASSLGGRAVTDVLARDEAPLVRAAAGIVSTNRGTSGLQALRAFVEDPDQSVRSLVLQSLDLPDEEEREAINLWATTPPQEATCLHCGTTNPGAAESCEKCRLTLPSMPGWLTGKGVSPQPRARRRRVNRRRLGVPPTPT